MYGYFLCQTGEIENKTTWLWLLNGNYKRDTESFQSNALWSNYIKANTDSWQNNRNNWSWGQKDETVYYIISKCSNLARKEYMSSYDLVEKFNNRFV